MYFYEEFGHNYNYQFHDKSTKSTVKKITLYKIIVNWISKFNHKNLVPIGRSDR